MDRQQADQRREMELEEAMEECFRKGVSPEHLKTLLYETGSRWTPKQDSAQNSRLG